MAGDINPPGHHLQPRRETPQELPHNRCGELGGPLSHFLREEPDRTRTGLHGEPIPQGRLPSVRSRASMPEPSGKHPQVTAPTPRGPSGRRHGTVVNRTKARNGAQKGLGRKPARIGNVPGLVSRRSPHSGTGLAPQHAPRSRRSDVYKTHTRPRRG